MTDVVFVTFEAGGNVPPALAVAQRVTAGGGSALILGSPSQRGEVEAAGCAFEPYSRQQPYSALSPMTTRENLRGMVAAMTDPGMAADAVALVRRTGARAVVVDCMLIGVIDALVRDSSARVVTLAHTLASFWQHSYARSPIGVVCGLRGFRPNRIWRSAAGTLATVLPGFDTGRATAFPDLVEIGPVTPVAPPARPVDPAPAGSRPRVLISLSTMWFPGQDRTMQKLLDAVAGLDAEVTVTAGRTIDPGSLRAPGNVELLGMADHDQLLARSDLLVGHGGHGTTMRAFAHDVPALVLPSFRYTDQPTVGRRVQALGAGRTLPTRTSVPRIRAAIEELVQPGPHRAAAAALGARIRALDPGRTAAEYLMAGSSSWHSTPPGSHRPPVAS